MMALLSGGGGEAGACAPTDVPANTPAITMAARTSHFPRYRMGHYGDRLSAPFVKSM